MSDSYENYLHDVGPLLRERATEAATALVVARSKNLDAEEIQYRLGRVMAYYEVLSTLVHQASIFQVSLTNIGLGEADIDKLLECMKIDSGSS